MKQPSKFSIFNPKRAGGGLNQPTTTLKACRFACDEVRTMKPSCNFDFGCLKQVNDINFGGCIWKFSKIFDFEKKNAIKNETQNFENLILCKFFHNKLYFFMSNLNLEWFQLSFDIHIVYVGKKWWIFKNCWTKS